MKRFVTIAAASVCIALAGCAGSTSGGGAGSSAQQAEYDRLLATGFEHLRQQRYGEARDVFAGLAQSYPDDAVVALALGVSHHELGQWDDAEAQYRRAVATGDDVIVEETILDGASRQETTTIAKLGRLNLEKLGQDRPK